MRSSRVKSNPSVSAGDVEVAVTVRRKWATGKEVRKDWICLCDTTNRYFLTHCSMCKIPKELAEEAKLT